jgi:hypothetical protein
VFFGVLFAVLCRIRIKKTAQSIKINKWFSLIVFSSVYIVAYVLSYSFTPILRDAAMVFILPFLFFGVLPTDVNLEDKKKSGLFYSVVFLTILNSIFIYKIQAPIHHGIFKEQGQFVQRIQQKYGKNNIEFASSYHDIAYLNYYLKDTVGEEIRDWSTGEALLIFKKRVDQSNKKYFCFSETNVELTPMYREIIKRKYPHLIDDLELPFSTATFSSRKKSNRHLKFITKAKSNKSLFISEEFFGGFSINVGKLPALKKRSSYYLMKAKGSLKETGSFYLVATITRKDSMLMKNDLPVFYSAFDQLNFVGINGLEFYSAFRLPEDLEPSDVLNIYAWNPEKRQLKIAPIHLYFSTN